ncbi:MAG: phosphate-starvation-inducible PsiE family protein [Bacteroidales bacterium]
MSVGKISRLVEKGIIYTLIGMMAIILVLATVELGYYLFRNIFSSEYLLIDLDDLLDLFGVFLLVLIGIELLDTIKVYLRNNVVHVEVVVLVAIIALARKVVVLEIEEMNPMDLLGTAALILALAVAYYLIKRAGLLVCDLDDKEEIKKELSKENTE